jgi:hypothetical protein
LEQLDNLQKMLQRFSNSAWLPELGAVSGTYHITGRSDHRPKEAGTSKLMVADKGQTQA